MISLEWLVLEESHLLLLDPEACIIVVEEDELVLADDASDDDTPFVEFEMFVDEFTGTLSDIASDGDVFPFV